MKMKSLLIVSVLVLLLAADLMASTSEAKTVTYADFTRVNSITVSMTHVYFATTEGIVTYNQSEGRWEDPLTGAEGVDNRDVRRIWVDQFNEKLYIQTSAGPYEYDLLFQQWFPVTEIPRLNTNYMHVKAPPVMYAPPGFNYDPRGFLTDKHGRDFYINDLVDDRSGNLWIGTWGYGAAVASSASSFVEFLTYGLIQNRAEAIYYDDYSDGVLWIGGSTLGSFRTGLSVFDVNTNRFWHIESGIGEGLPDIDINCIEGDDRYIYLGSDAGLFFVDREGRQVTRSINYRSGLPDDNVLALKAIGDSLFVGTTSGLALLTSNADSLSLIRPGQFLNNIIYDFETTDSSIWIASSNGAFQLHLRTGRLQKFQDPNAIVFNRAYRIERVNSDVWLASDDGIVNVNLASGRTTAYSSMSGAFGRRALAVSDQIAATATNRGLMVYFLDENEAYEREFTVDDGLPSNNILALLVDGDYLWIGSDRGLTRFLWNDPDRID